MKRFSQNDLIVIIATVVIGLGITIAFWFMKRVPVAPPAPASVVTATPTVPPPGVQYAASLPGGGGSPMGGSGMGGFGGPGGMPGMSGMSGGMGSGKAAFMPGAGPRGGKGGGASAAGF